MFGIATQDGGVLLYAVFILQKETEGEEQAVLFHAYIKSGEGKWMLSILHTGGCAMYLIFPGALCFP